MQEVVVMRVVDRSDFDKVLYSVACASHRVAWDHADTALAQARNKVGKEWHYALELEYETLPLVEVA